MERKIANARVACVLGCAAVVVSAGARLVLFLAEPLDAQLAVIPDDAFYYVLAAKRFALTGEWSFDGVAPATGFHLLYGYLLAVLFRAAPELSNAGLFALLGAGATALLGASAYLVARAASHELGPRAALGVVLVFCAPIALTQQTFLVESVLVIFFSSALLDVLARGGDSKSWLALAFAVGLAGNLSRSDFGLLGAACAVALWWARRAGPARLAAAATAGAALGVCVLALHTFALTGEWLQSSARMKSHWGALLGYDVLGFARHLVDVILPSGLSWLGTRAVPAALLALGAAGAVTRLGRDALSAARRPLAFGCAASVAGYLVFYGRASAGVPPWYLANALAALAYLAGAALCFLPARAFGPAVAVVAVCAALNVPASLRPIWPNHAAMRSGGEYLRSHPEVAPVGAWNAGIVARFAERPVTNLDGLINDEIQPYAVSGRLLEYVCARKLRFVLDFADNVDNPVLARRAGYADGKLRAALTPEVNFSNGDSSRQWMRTDLQLYRFDERACREGVTP